MKDSWLRHSLGLARMAAPLDRGLARLSAKPLEDAEIRRLRWFWLDGLFATISASFYGSFVPLFAVAYGANNAQVGQLTAIASLCGMAGLLPGAKAIELAGGRRKAVVVVSGAIARLALLGWLVLPWATRNPAAAIAVIIAINAVITFAGNFANPAWTAIVADIVPRPIRGRFFSHRNIAVNLPTLLVVPLAGWLIQVGNRPGAPFAGYQIVFALALASGAVATWAYAKISDPAPAGGAQQRQPLTEVSRIIRSASGFLGLVFCTLIWNLGSQMPGPFLNIYIVNELGGTTAAVGWVAASGGLAALLMQRWLGRWVDHRGSIWVQGLLSFVLPWVPIAWMLSRAPWHLIIINAVAGVLWTAYGLASFNLLLDLAPEQARAEANALFQLVIAGSAVISPMIGGYLADAYGYAPIFVASCVLRVLGAVAFLFLIVRPARRRPQRQAART